MESYWMEAENNIYDNFLHLGTALKRESDLETYPSLASRKVACSLECNCVYLRLV